MKGKVFRSRLEDLVEAEELLFEPTVGFGSYKRFLGHAIAHPAKMNMKLLEFLVEKFTREGDVILDPMAGTGSTGVVSALLGRNAINVELEEKFWKWEEEAKTRLEHTQTLTPKGSIRNILGDARRLSELLKEQTDIVITSPPYSEGIGHDSGDKASERFKERLEMQRKYTRQMKSVGNIAKLKHGEINAIITSPPYAEMNKKGSMRGFIIPKKLYHRKHLDKSWVITGETEGGEAYICNRYHPNEYSESEENIGNLPLENVDVVITSPPYSDISKPGNIKNPISKEEFEERKNKGDHSVYHDIRPERKGTLYEYYEMIPIEKYGNNLQNIDNLPLGNVDVVITSPPYSESMSKKRKGYTTHSDLSKTRHMGEDSRDNNIANLPHGSIDAVITSPPYESSLSQDHNEQKEKEIYFKTGQHDRGIGRSQAHTIYSESKDNIGNLKSKDEEYEKLKVDAIITSPPYGEAHSRGDLGVGDRDRADLRAYSWLKTENPDDIGNLPFVDTIITSPPYAHESTASKPTKLEKQGSFKMGHSKETPYTAEDYREWNHREGGNIGKKRLLIRIPCNQKEAQFHDTRKGRKGTAWEWTKEVEGSPDIIETIQKTKSKEKGRSETYIEAMFKCYKEMFAILKPHGLCIVVIKPFIRNKRVVDLPYHTWLLLERAGFKLVNLFKLKLKNPSFWRILYYKKHPNVPKIGHEYVLVCRKA